MTGESQAVGLNDVSVLIPSSADEAVAAFGDGKDVTVVAGGTIVLPDLVAGRAPCISGGPASRGSHAPTAA